MRGRRRPGVRAKQRVTRPPLSEGGEDRADKENRMAQARKGAGKRFRALTVAG